MKDNKVPKATETIAAKRAARVARKLNKAGKGIVSRKAWWSNSLLEIVAILIVIFLNGFVVSAFWGDKAPPTTFSGPLIPLIAKGIAYFGLSLSNAIGTIYIVSYLVLPVGMYLFIKVVSNRKLVAFISTLFLGLTFYPFALFRLNSMFATTDGPHIASLAFIPFGLLALFKFLRQGKIRNLILSVIFSTLVLLTSPFGFSIFVGMATITTFSEILLGRTRVKLTRLVLVLLLSVGLASFWYNPQFIHRLIFGPLGEELRITLSRLLPISFFAVPVLAAFGFLLFDRKPEMQPIFLASFYTIIFGIIVLAGGGFFPSHPSRYMSELGITISFLAGILLTKITDYIRVNGLLNYEYLRKYKSFIANIVIILLLSGLIAAMILGRARLGVIKSNVLGLWTGVERGEIWIARDNVSGFSEILGYVISGVTVFGLSVVATKAKLEQVGDESEYNNAEEF